MLTLPYLPLLSKNFEHQHAICLVCSLFQRHIKCACSELGTVVSTGKLFPTLSVFTHHMMRAKKSCECLQCTLNMGSQYTLPVLSKQKEKCGTDVYEDCLHLLQHIDFGCPSRHNTLFFRIVMETVQAHLQSRQRYEERKRERSAVAIRPKTRHCRQHHPGVDG